MKRSPILVLALFLAALLLMLAFLPAIKRQAPMSAAPDPQHTVQRAWELVRQAGSYSFIAHVDQESIPLAIPSNIGKQSQKQTARLEGTTDLVNRKMEFTLNANGGSILDAQSGTQIKIDGDEAFSRTGQQAWQKIDDFSASFAPQSDFMAFLAGARNIELADPAGENGIARYTYEVDGPGFAAYMRDKLIQQLSYQGKLPVGVEFGLSEALASLSGTGEIWIRADGLPVRQVLHLQFPPSSQDQVQADVRVSFLDFGALPVTPAAQLSPLDSLPGLLQSKVFRELCLAAGALALGLFTLLLGLRRKPVYIAIICVLITAMLIGPILQSAQAAAFFQEQLAKTQEQEQNQQIAQIAQDISQTADQIPPNVSPLAAALAARTAGAAASSVIPPWLPTQQAAPQILSSTQDSDSDGLPDDQENLLGTNPSNVDTDGDSNSDSTEVTGITLGGKTWYGDPRRQDTNGDGVGDNREWGKDTDGDLTPDLWDLDNDNDSVPDQADLSPFQKGVISYDGDNPFSLSFQNLTPNTPTYVEIQVRPTNPAHLRYANQVLDWPEGDLAGQIMDGDGKTFKDVNPESDLPQDADGDVKLVPMLEIQIHGSPDNLPDQATLDKYGISIHNLTQDGSQKAAFIPLQVISEGGDNWVAFSGKMFYMPAANWGEPQLVRLAWMVEALNDICAPAEPEDEAGTQVEHVGGCTTVETYNDLQVVQIYYDDFSLTGLNVREDHGTTWELVYKDPLAITEVPKTDRINRLAPLNDLVFGLDHTFLAGRVDPKTGERDFPVTEIRRRFDHSINSTVPISPTRFNISDNILLVNPYQYAHIDLAYTDITITQTKSILDVYTPFWSVTEPITPTILFAHEEYYRPLNLDSMGAYSNITVTPDGIQYSISLPSSVPADSPMAPVEVFTATALSWAPYIFQGGEWKGAPLDDYLESLSSIYPPNQIDPDPAVAKGALMFLETYYANIYQGYFNIVEQGEQVVETLIEETDEVVAEYLEHWEMVYEPFKIAMEIFFDLQLPYYIYDAIGQIKTFFSNIYSVVNGKIMGLGEFKSFWFYEGISFLEKGSMLAMGIAALAWIITHIPPIHEKLDESVWGKIIIVAISASFTVLITIKTVQAAMKIFAEFGELAASKASELGVIGLIVVTFLFIVAAIAIFGYVMAHNDDINGVQVGLMVATLFAQIVVILLFAFISAIPYIGPIIMAIYNLVNTILSEFLGVSFTEMLIANITEIFYHIDPMVSLTPSVGETVMGFLTEHGVSANNGVNISFPMDVLAMQEDPQTDMEERISNDKDYDLLGTRVSLDVDGNESAITSDSQWKDTYLSHYSHLYDWPRYATHGYLTGNLDTIQFTQAGINQSFTYDSSFYFKIHFWRCILFVFCNDETTHSSIEGEDPPVVFDVFPATIDEFIAWNWEPTLPEHHDLDNDGLLAPSHHGNDPDDTKWDADGDLLSDKWEIDMAAKPATEGGFAYNALKADTDGDGLKDGEEARRGTNPARLDSDGDGRSDFSEVDGYNFVYASPKQVRVFSNPLVYDSDGDGMDDKVEHYLYTKDPVQFPYNPSAWNTVPLALKVQAGVSGFISPGVTFPLTITLQNSADTNIKGDVTTTLPTGITAVNPTTQTYEALANDTAALTNSIQVASNISSSSSLNISSTACGTLEMPLVYLPFDEPVGSVTFYNQATQGRYDMLCQGSMYCPLAGVAGQKGSAVKFQSAIQASILTLSTPDLVFSNKHPFSISVWVYPSSTTRTDKFYLVSQASSSNFSSGYNLYFTTDAQHRYITHFTTAAKEYVFNQPILPSVWTNLVATFDGTNQRLFINGVEASGTLASNVVMSPSTAQVWIGGVRSATYAYILNYLGVMDELFIYDRVLADGEIKALSQLSGIHDPLATESPANSACQLTASQEITVTVDTDTPTVSITSPANGAFLNGNRYQVIGGEAHDPTSFIRLVEVSVDGGPYVPASGAESWAYTWDLRNLAPGVHTLDARATDALGHVSPVSRVGIKIDRTAPTVSWEWWNTSWVWPAFIRFRDMQTWYFDLEGTASDSSSGLASVEVLFDGGPGLPYGGWQAARIDTATGKWYLDYTFPLSVTDLNLVPNPSGSYALRLRATDKVGNITEITDPQPARMDNEAPVASLFNLNPTAVITQPLTLSGVVTDTTSTFRLSVGLVPVEQVEVMRDAALVMHLNEKWNSNYLNFMDASGLNQTGYSEVGHTPNELYIPGKVDEAITFYGTSSYIRWREPLKTSFTNAITAAMWFKNKQAPTANTTLMVLDHAAALYWKTAGGLTFSVTDSSGQTFEVSSNLALTDTNWHHVVGAWDGTTISIYIDSVLAGSYVPAGMGLLDTSSSQLTLANSVAGVNGYVGYIDEFLLFPRGFTDQEAANLYGLGMRAWKYAVLDDYSAPITPWTYTLPAGLEGLYEIDLRGIDDWDNRDDHPAGWNAWQGEIDMLAPRVSLNAVNQGATTEVQCSSTDFNLSRDNYQCPCTTLQSDLTTYDQVNNWYKEVLIDQTRLYKIMSKCSVPAGTPLQMQACDIYGRCSTGSATASSEPDWKEAGAFTLVTPEMLLQGPPSPIDSPPEPGEVKPAPQPSLLPVSRLIDPPDGSQVSSRQPLTLTLQADAISALQLITVTLDGGLLTSLSFPDPVVTSTLTTIPWTPDPNLAAGAHVLQASALDWVGQTQAEFFPVTLFFDSQSPPADVHPNQAPEPAAAQSNLPPTSALLEPPDHSVLPNLDPLDLKVGAEGLNGLKAITVTLDGGWLSTISLPNDPITRTLVTIPWTPDPTLADGAHLFQTNALDWAGLAQTQLFTSTLFVDTQVPSIDISPTVLTTTQQIANWAVNLGGPVGDLAGIKSVEVALQDGTGALTPAPGPPGAQGNPWNAAAVVGDRWSYPYRTDTLPDGQVINVVVQATDLAGHIQQAVRPVTLDLVPPTPITMTVSYANSQGIVTQVLPGQTILDVMNPTLLIEWTPASDGSGLRTYYAGLSQDDSPDLANLATVNPVGPLQYSQATSEVQAYTAFVVSEDIYGNRSWNRLGPIYVDTPLTPDLIALPSTADNGDIYHGWMDSGDSQIGINRIIAENVPPGFSLNGDQKFYLSWDATALRLAWLGADWNSEGDLYIYMKTGTGMGSNQAYNPFTATFSDTLTLPMAADTLLWVTDSQSAHLMRWNGAAWFDALPGGLGPEYFRFTARSPRSVTDLYLPFALLGIANPGTTPLDLIAFGSQEQALRLWTVFPITNPHNSPILSKLLLLLPDQHHLVMNHAYHWPDLALGQSPNRSVYLDVDVRSLIVADPTGVISDTRQSGLYLSSLFHLPTESPLIGDGQVINYTLNYINIGGASAPNEHLILRITSAGPLVLPGGTKIIRPDGSEGYVREIDLGPILPGSRGTTQFTGLVNVSPLQAKYQICLKNHPGNPQDCQQLYDLLHTARIDAYLSTTHANGMIINTFSVKHSLAVDPPVGVAILSAQGDLSPVLDAANQEELSGIPPQVLKDAQTFPPIFVRSGINTLNGSAYDPSGVAGVTVQILDPDGDTTDTHCNVSAPKSGLWSCAVSLPQAPNDTRYFARARASNPFGYTSDWSRWRVLLIDSLPPTATLDAESLSALTAAVIGPVKTKLSGQIMDNDQVANVDICLGPVTQAGVSNPPSAFTSCQTIELNNNNVLTGTWSATLEVPISVDYASQKLTLYGIDAAGNRSSQPLETTYWFDSVAPQVAVTSALSTVHLGDYTRTPVPILSGTAGDGSGQVEIVVRLTSPTVGTQRSVVQVQNNQWSYFPDLNFAGDYTISLAAWDAAGNLTSLGTWSLQVTDGYNLWLPRLYR